MNRAFEFFEKDKAPQWEPRNEYFEFYKKMNALKHSQEALAAGTAGGSIVKYETVSPDLLVFSREKDSSKVVTMVNLGSEEQAVEFKGAKPDVSGMKDYFRGEPADVPMSLEAGEYLIFVNA